MDTPPRVAPGSPGKNGKQAFAEHQHPEAAADGAPDAADGSSEGAAAAESPSRRKSLQEYVRSPGMKAVVDVVSSPVHSVKSSTAVAQHRLAAVLPSNARKKHIIIRADGTQTVVRQERSLIDRKTSQFMPWWDGTMLVALLFAATVTPYEVTFLASGPCVTPLFVVNRCVDLLFCADIVITFHLIDEDPNSGRKLITRAQISHRYLRTWFPIDFVSILPFWIFNWVCARSLITLSQTTHGASPLTPGVHARHSTPLQHAPSTLRAAHCLPL